MAFYRPVMFIALYIFSEVTKYIGSSRTSPNLFCYNIPNYCKTNTNICYDENSKDSKRHDATECKISHTSNLDLQKCSNNNNAKVEEQILQEYANNSKAMGLPYEPKFQTVVVAIASGRLGNHLWSYMWLSFVKFTYGLQIFLPSSTKEALTKIFKQIGQHKTANHACGYNEFFLQYRDALDKMMEQWLEEQSGQNVSLIRNGERFRLEPPEIELLYPYLNTATVADLPEFIHSFEVDYTKLHPGCLYKV